MTKLTFRQRLMLAVNATRTRLLYAAPEIEEFAARTARRIRCEVYQENNNTFGRAVFN